MRIVIVGCLLGVAVVLSLKASSNAGDPTPVVPADKSSVPESHGSNLEDLQSQGQRDVADGKHPAELASSSPGEPGKEEEGPTAESPDLKDIGRRRALGEYIPPTLSERESWRDSSGMYALYLRTHPYYWTIENEDRSELRRLHEQLFEEFNSVDLATEMKEMQREQASAGTLTTRTEGGRRTRSLDPLITLQGFKGGEGGNLWSEVILPVQGYEDAYYKYDQAACVSLLLQGGK